jgi:citrate lyase gamma subunit
LQVVERFGHALSAEVVQTLEKHHVEASLVSIHEKLLER